VKAQRLHQQFRQARNGRRDASSLVGRQMAVAERPFLQVVATVQLEAGGVADFEAVRTGLFDP
jgi:hypothetical protein